MPFQPQVVCHAVRPGCRTFAAPLGPAVRFADAVFRRRCLSADAAAQQTLLLAAGAAAERDAEA